MDLCYAQALHQDWYNINSFIRAITHFFAAAIWGAVAGVTIMYACAPYELVTKIPIFGRYYLDEKIGTHYNLM
jgi:hypothetical protein